MRHLEQVAFMSDKKSSLKPAAGFSGSERDAVYKYTGGITLISTATFNEHQKLIAGRVSHVVVDQKAAHVVRSTFDYQMANFIAESR